MLNFFLTRYKKENAQLSLLMFSLKIGQFLQWSQHLGDARSGKGGSMLIDPCSRWEVYRPLALTQFQDRRNQQIVTHHKLVRDGEGSRIFGRGIPHGSNDGLAMGNHSFGQRDQGGRVFGVQVHVLLGDCHG